MIFFSIFLSFSRTVVARPNMVNSHCAGAHVNQNGVKTTIYLVSYLCVHNDDLLELMNSTARASKC